MCIVSNLSCKMFTYYVHFVVQSYPWCNWVFSFVLAYALVIYHNEYKQRKIINSAKGKIKPQHTYYINTWHFPVQFALKTWSFIKWLTPDLKKKKHTHTLIPFICKHFYIHIYQVVNVMYLCSCQCTKPKCNSTNCIWHLNTFTNISLQHLHVLVHIS